MPNSLIVEAFSYENPEKTFLICDLNEGREFVDPLDLFGFPGYNKENNDNGLFAIGGNLDIPTLLASYRWGIFPWFPHKYYDTPFWHCPPERYVIFPEKIHVGHSLRNILNKKKYHITVNKDFRSVIRYCRTVDNRDSNDMSWLGSNIESLFIELHDLGYAKSVEVWEGEELAGGFYGFYQNGVFQGESMFSLRPSASQVGLVMLCRNPYIENQRIKFIDTQFETPTFKHLGGEYIPYSEYRRIMES